MRARGDGDFWGKEGGGMKYVDYLLNWTLFITAIVFMLVTEVAHPPGVVLDMPFLWLLIAITNFVRLRNADVLVKGLNTTCIAANLIGLITEACRARLWGWGPYTAIVAVAIFGEVVFSIVRRNDPNPPAPV